MNIQIITNASKDFKSSENITYATLNAPNTLDAFDLNIISLQGDEIWKNEEDSNTTINVIKDFISLKKNLESFKKSRTVILLPQNYTFEYYRNYQGNYTRHQQLKDILSSLDRIIFELLPSPVVNVTKYQTRFELVYENSKTQCANAIFTAAFSLSDKVSYFKVLTKCIGSERPTTIQKDNLIITTLDLQSNSKKLDDFLLAIGILKKRDDVPVWVKNYDFLDDSTQNETIKTCENKIAEMKKQIVAANESLAKNLKYKSMLYETGNNLVQIVYDVLGKILRYDMSSFEDEHKEDFLIKLNDITFIGEIKGISSNVRSENVSQLDVHFNSYLDKLQDLGASENVKALLIINPFRNKPLNEREEIHKIQIDLATRNNSLIITTHTLLLIYEKFLKGSTTTEHIIDIFKDTNGLLNIESI